MHLRKVKKKDTGRVYLSIVESYREKGSKYPKSRTIESLGYLDDLEKQYKDPIAFFNKKIEEMNAQQAEDKSPISFAISKDEELEKGVANRKNFGYAVLSCIYHELRIHTFLINRQRHTKEKYSANAIMKLLLFSRILFPGSKRKDHESRERFFEKFDFSLDDVYRCLTFLEARREDLQLHLHQKIQSQYGRDTSLAYYDVTNYYFEIDEQDELRRKGVSKEHRPDPIVQMGLLCDTNGIPIAYNLFPGNTPDKSTLRPTLSKVQADYNLGKTIVVGDRGIITADNIWYLLSAKNGYVFSLSIKGSDKAFKEYVLEPAGYRSTGEEQDFIIKSRLYPRTIKVTSKTGRKIPKTVHEKHVVFWSKKYADKAKAEREATLKKARDLVKSPSRYTKSNSYGASKYIKNITFDKDTGEVLVDAKAHLYIDQDAIDEEARFDGYYAIVTSEQTESDERILEIYRRLWKIEEAFKITKSDLASRPVFVSTEEHIRAHFLTCFFALVIARVLEYRMGRKYPLPAMLESLRQASCSHLAQNYYLFDYFDDILDDLGRNFDIDFSKKILSLGDIKKVLAGTKKG